MVVQFHRPVTLIKSPAAEVGGVHIHTYPGRISGPKPGCKESEELGCNADAPMVHRDIDLLQFPVTVVPLGEVSGDEPHENVALQRDV